MPVAGALVSLVDPVSDSALASTLSNRVGEYALRAAPAVSYRIAVKRIGVRRFFSAPFELDEGETRVLDVLLDPIALALPAVSVSGLCVVRPRDLARVASLWDEARTALEAAEISLRDRLIPARISRYAADLDPPTLRVLFDWRSDAEVMARQPFTSLSGDSLSILGYWRHLPGDSVEYLAPDASALVSNAFLRDHCFSLAPGRRGRADLVGLGFQPASGRLLPDITGTIWLDARRFELQFIEFRYTRLPRFPNADRVGGEVHFTRLESGAWIVDRWFIRMPQVVVPPDDWPRRQLREEGGSVIADGIGASPLAAVSGIVRDSAGQPFPGAVVRAVGTPRQAVTDATGAYRLDSLPLGGHSVVVHADGYESLGMLATTRRLELPGGRTQRLDLRALNTRDLQRELCPVMAVPSRSRRDMRGVLRVVMVDSASAAPMPGVRFLVSWPAAAEGTLGSPIRQERIRQAVTDARGGATFCGLPTAFSLEVSLLGRGGQRAHVMMVQAEPDVVLGRVLTGRVNR